MTGNNNLQLKDPTGFVDSLGRPLFIGDKIVHVQMSGRSSFSMSKKYVAGVTPKFITVARDPSKIGAPSKDLGKAVTSNTIRMDDNEPGWPV